MANTNSGVSWKKVRIQEGFWGKRMEVNRHATLPQEYIQCKESGRVDSIKKLYDVEHDTNPQKGTFTIDGVLTENMVTDGRIPRPHHYWDSDLAKWIEAASYSLFHEPDKRVEGQIDSIVDDFEMMQEEDGYLNTYFTVVEPGKRWTNTYRMHELYCAGHLIEAAIAYYEATGKQKFLDIIYRYADYIQSVFGPEEGKIHGYPGHQEIELALVKLWRISGKKKYLDLAAYFINERGRKPYFFEEEAKRYGRNVEDGGPKGILGKNYLSAGPYALFQAHLPVREQKTAEGHAVRLTYMGCAMADLSLELNDETLWKACKTLWNNVTLKRMYITGGVGSVDGSERFTFDYDLPNEEAYQETCASVGMVMWAYRMLSKEPDRIYGDVMEKALYNGVICGVSVDGENFFYANHLGIKPEVFENRIIRNPRMFPVRQKWFPVSCCPMNLARLIESIGGYLYTKSKDTIFLHLYIDSEADLEWHGQNIRVIQKTNFPWEGMVKLIVSSPKMVSGTLAFRIPGWSRDTQIKVPKHLKDEGIKGNGYYYVSGIWSGETEILIELDMKPFLVESHPYVRMNAGKAAIQAGAIIYCIEERDNGKNLETIFIDPNSTMKKIYRKDVLGGITVIEADAYRKNVQTWEHSLYKPIADTWKKTKLYAVPWFCFANRGEGEMLVWINSFTNRIKEI